MTLIELKETIEAINKEAKKKTLDALDKYAHELPYQPGMIVKDHIGFARIKHLHSEYLRSGLPDVSWDCENLTLRMTVNKREPERVVHCSNIKGIVEQ